MTAVSGINRDQASTVTTGALPEHVRIALIISSIIVAVLLIAVAAYSMQTGAATLPMQADLLPGNYAPQIGAFISAALLLAIAAALSMYSSKQKQKPVLDLPPETPNIVARPVAPPPAVVQPKRAIVHVETTIFQNAPMPGKLTTVYKKLGDSVSRGEDLCILTSMKMENTIRAYATGRITAIHVQAGETVDTNAPLFTIEKE